MVTVMLVDDQELIRTGLRIILDSHSEIEVVADVGDGISAIRKAEESTIDVVLMDLNMPGIDGVETTRRLHERFGTAGPRILVLTTFDQDTNVLAALRAGAVGFLSKGAGPAELIDGILRTARGENALSASAIGALVGLVSEPLAPQPDPEKVALFSSLTSRELEVVGLIVDGLDNAEIGRRIFISPFTVKTHANRAMMKIGARDRAQLVSLAVQAGLRS